ncbi:MAG: SsrA-binding protein SmpB [Chitinispirillaceae bacterium]|nr:SsrA-binding protein SmpB [Chitinispirillaceae bacterium]
MSIIAKNRKAFHDYEILEKFEAGIALCGAEVKAVRAGKVNLSDSYAHCSDGELFINHLHISSYTHVSFRVPDPYRKRKLLLNKKEILHLDSEVERRQLTLIPLSLYFKKQWVKLELGLCRGRKKWDKRRKIAENESKRKIRQLMSGRRGI